jgi:hypothetical protein
MKISFYVVIALNLASFFADMVYVFAKFGLLAGFRLDAIRISWPSFIHLLVVVALLPYSEKITGSAAYALLAVFFAALLAAKYAWICRRRIPQLVARSRATARQWQQNWRHDRIAKREQRLRLAAEQQTLAEMDGRVAAIQSETEQRLLLEYMNELTQYLIRLTPSTRAQYEPIVLDLLSRMRKEGWPRSRLLLEREARNALEIAREREASPIIQRRIRDLIS